MAVSKKIIMKKKRISLLKNRNHGIPNKNHNRLSLRNSTNWISLRSMSLTSSISRNTPISSNSNSMSCNMTTHTINHQTTPQLSFKTHIPTNNKPHTTKKTLTKQSSTKSSTISNSSKKKSQITTINNNRIINSTRTSDRRILMIDK
jgi:hypothetical protein